MAILFLNNSGRVGKTSRARNAKGLKQKKRNHLEQDQQILFFNQLILYPRIWAVTFAIPNGGSRGGGKSIINKKGQAISTAVLEGKRLKMMGVKPGVPDIFIAMPFNGYSGIFIEMKSEDGKLTPSQEYMIPLLRQQGYFCVICKSAKEAMDVVLRIVKNEF